MHGNKILYAISQNTCFIKLIGYVKLNMSSGFDSLVRQELQRKRINQFVIDLRKAEYLDSTNLGLLCTIATRMKAEYNRKPIIISPPRDIKIVLDAMGFDNLFDYSDKIDESDLKYYDTTEIKYELRKTREFVLDSHKALTEINEANKKKFANVIEAIQNKKLLS